jgi:beta-galactosidase
MIRQVLFPAVFVLCCSFVSAVASYLPPDSQGQWQCSLNGEWKFCLNGPEAEFQKMGYDDSQWGKIKVPGNWELQGFEEPAYKEPKNVKGVGLYRTRFDVPVAWKDRRVTLRFDGVLFGYELWINGAWVQRFESGFNRCDFDITSLVKYGTPNILAVRVYRQGKGWQFDTNDDWALSGIYRDVTLFSVPKTHIEDFTVVTELNDSFTQALVRVQAVLGGPKGSHAMLRGRLLDPNGRAAGTFSKNLEFAGISGNCEASIQVSEPLLWNAETPNLYELKLELNTAS